MPVFPVPLLAGVAPRISDSYGYSPVRGRLHAGSDLMYRRPETGKESLPVFAKNYFMPDGVPALAFDDGIVTRAGQIGTGGRVEIDHGGGFSTKYYHLTDIRVKPGERIKAGQPVGIIGHNPTGYRLNHLHFETLKNGVPFDPAGPLKKAIVVPPPSTTSFVAKLAASVVLGLLISKYVFR
jgi:murein DD-endopeptidase MepM/ murein hydrolase activator NlpD